MPRSFLITHKRYRSQLAATTTDVIIENWLSKKADEHAQNPTAHVVAPCPTYLPPSFLAYNPHLHDGTSSCPSSPEMNSLFEVPSSPETASRLAPSSPEMTSSLYTPSSPELSPEPEQTHRHRDLSRPPIDFAAFAHTQRSLLLSYFPPNNFVLPAFRAKLDPPSPDKVYPDSHSSAPQRPLPPPPHHQHQHPHHHQPHLLQPASIDDGAIVTKPWPELSPGNCSSSNSSSGGSIGVGGEEFPCPDCGKRYSTSSNLARHRQTHRSVTDKKARKCPHCDKVYVSMPAFSMHVRTHSVGCECHFCGKRFSRPWLLQGHIRTHTGEKPFKCSQCGKAFADKSNLRAHVQTHSADKPYTCERCGKAFALKSYLYKHEESSCMRGQRFTRSPYVDNVRAQ